MTKAAVTLQAQGTQQGPFSTIIAGIAGNVLEWYDFAVYGFFAPVFAQLFFPSQDKTASLIATYGAFAAGFLMRPVGAAIFGHVGDRFGRKRALNLSVMLMALPTFMIGILPTHAQIGMAASVLLVVLRMLQGLSVGGEYTGSIVYLAERAPQGKRGFFASFPIAGALGGILLGSLVGTLITEYTNDAELAAWGWRLPFLFGILIALVGYLIRRHMEETLPAQNAPKQPLREVLKFKNSLLRASGLNLMAAVAFYAFFIFAATWLIEYVHEPKSTALKLNTISLLIMLFAMPLAALLSDRIGRKRMLLISTAAMAIFAYPLIKLMHHEDPALILTGQALLAILLALSSGPIPAVLTEMFPTRVRVCAVSIGYNITYAIFGGTTPMVAVWLIHREHSDLAFVWYIIGAAVIAMFFIWKIQERKDLLMPE